MKKIILLLLIGILISCTKNNEPKEDFELKEFQVLFAPSFLPPTEFTIDIEKKTIKQYTRRNSYYAKEYVDSISYKEKRKDTLIIYYQKTFPIDTLILDKFLVELKESQLDSTTKHQRATLDGIGYRISKISHKNDTISLTSNITNRENDSKKEYKILDAFFKLSHESIYDYEGVTTIENIQDYFSYGLPIKKINENPIEYRVYGGISGCRDDNQDLLTFLENLPNDEPVIFDLRNGSIAGCLNEVLIEFGKKKKIYFYGERNFYGEKNILPSEKILLKIKEAKINLEKQKIHKILKRKRLNDLLEDEKRHQLVKCFTTKNKLLKHINKTE